MAASARGEREQTLADERRLREERLRARVARVQRQKAERRCEAHAVQHRKQARERLLARIAAHDADIVTTLTSTKLRPAQQQLQAAKAEYADVLVRYRLAKKEAERASGALQVVREAVATRRVAAEAGGGQRALADVVKSAWG